MNYLKLITGLLITSMLFTSCQKDVLSPDSPQETLQSELRVEDGALHIPSADAFYELLETLGTADEKSLNDWEQRLGFTSYRSIANKAIAEIENPDNANVRTALLRKYQDLIEVGLMGTYVPKLDFEYALVANEAGFFYIGNTLNTVYEGQLFAIQNGDTQKLENAIRNPNLQEEGVFVTKFPETSFARTDCSDYVYGAYSSGENHGDVKVAIGISTETLLIYDENLYAQSRVHIGAQTDTKLNGTWYQVNADITVNNIGGTVHAMYGVVAPFEFTSLSFHKKGFIAFPIGPKKVFQQGEPVFVDGSTFTSAYGTAYSSITGPNNFAEIDCQ